MSNAEDIVYDDFIKSFKELVDSIVAYRYSLSRFIDASDEGQMAVSLGSHSSLSINGELRDDVLEVLTSKFDDAGKILVELQEQVLLAKCRFDDMSLARNSPYRDLPTKFSDENIERFGAPALRDLLNMVQSYSTKFFHKFSHVLVGDKCLLLDLDRSVGWFSYRREQGWFQLNPEQAEYYRSNNANVVTIDEALSMVNMKPIGNASE